MPVTVSVRIIPARAGFTGARRPQARQAPDHPRSRGVYSDVLNSSAISWGSSPLARGLRGNVEICHDRFRIIPARAGFTIFGVCAGRGFGDHPRSRGVYAPFHHRIADPPGSSPLARGLLAGDDREGLAPGIIPARAGFTLKLDLFPVDGWDHPRSRGVYTASSTVASSSGGSSPFARGLQRRAPRGYLQARIIPARAGFTGPRRGRGTPPADHPRSRGVYTAPVLQVSRADGSSPLARGLLRGAECPIRCARIIPARAGFTGGVWCADSAGSDHPRSRGVYSPCVRCLPPMAGSSPLARGLRRGEPLPCGLQRIIPARAGFTYGTALVAVDQWDHPRSRGVY